MTVQYLIGNVFDRLAEIPDGTVDLVVTSPPFLGLRSYLPDGHPDKDKEIGGEKNPAEFIDVLLEVTAELRRVLASHGSIAVELGDTYSGSGGAGGDYTDEGWRGGQPKFKQGRGVGWPQAKSMTLIPETYRWALAYGRNPFNTTQSPAGTWIVRNTVTWCRPNPAVGSLGDKWRPATSDMVIACLSSKRYWDDIATRKPHVVDPATRAESSGKSPKRADALGDSGTWNSKGHEAGAPLLDYWELSTQGGYPGAHYAVYPPALVEPCIKAMSPPGGMVLDPFAGSGTTLHVADALGRDAIGIDIDERNKTIYESRRDDRKFNELRQGTLL